MKNLSAINNRLTKTHTFPVPQRDMAAIAEIYRIFYEEGFAIRPSPTYADLMTATDEHGVQRSYLASEENFQVLKELELKNLVVPVVGDFGGPSALRRVGDYVRSHHDAVRAFYGSNVGVYLNTQQTQAFCRSLAALPASPEAWFIESDGVRSFASKLKGCPADKARTKR